MILYIPYYMQSSQHTHRNNIDDFFKTFARSTTFATKTFSCHDTTYTRLEAIKVCMREILVTEIALV
jgi:hypothetical protein